MFKVRQFHICIEAYLYFKGEATIHLIKQYNAITFNINITYSLKLVATSSTDTRQTTLSQILYRNIQQVPWFQIRWYFYIINFFAR